ncbi:glycosyltransferase [Leuconostoc falkenbergense]|uniref:glycosyltransferase n=1 Tax=Leuconostoc falkenbergense TaxID=2766470 RepID=UPI0021AA2CF7|nr:glycosyltransferase [Leuconostoc falkenbergense]MCT4378085.1 glycosyltransferase [Leuconostoc falkenbergense]
MKIAVLMSTFNGHEYLYEQLYSIVNQEVEAENIQIEVYIRDDGSTDGTIALIKKISIEYPNIHLTNSFKNIGVKMSFFKLVQEINADFYFLSDQDDIWEKNKVQLFLDIFNNKKKNDEPFGAYSDMWIADEKGKSTGKLLKNGTSKEPLNKEYVEFDELMFSNKVTGSSFAFDKLARNQIQSLPENIIQQSAMHDEIFAMVIAAKGKLFYVAEPLTYYRQHKKNVLGYSGIQRLSIKDKLSKLKVVIAGDMQLINDIEAITQLFSTSQTNNLYQLFAAKTILSQYQFLKAAIQKANSRHRIQLMLLYLFILKKWNGNHKYYD